MHRFLRWSLTLSKGLVWSSTSHAIIFLRGCLHGGGKILTLGRSRRWIILAHMFSVFSLHAKDWLVPGLHVGSSKKYKGYASTMSTAFTRKNPTWNATIPDKTTWESFPHHVHFPTQQNYFQNDAFAERKPLPPIQCCFPQTPRDQAFFWIHNNIAFRGGRRGKNRYSYDV